jgi:hypothetical protein
MCRSIVRLREGTAVASDDEIRAAARQFVRKVSGFREPTGRHEEAFEAAVEEIAASSRRLLATLTRTMSA